MLSLIGYVLIFLGVALVAGAFFARSTEKNKLTFRDRVSSFLSGVILFAIGVSILPSPSPTQQSQAPQTQLAQPTQPAQETQPTGPTEEEKPKVPIPPTLGVESSRFVNWVRKEFGLSFTSHENSVRKADGTRIPLGTWDLTAKGVDASTGAEISLTVKVYEDQAVEYTFMVWGEKADEVAQAFFPILSIVALRDDVGGKVARWVERSLGKVAFQKPVEAVIDDVLVELYGNPPLMFGFELKHKDFPEYIGKVADLVL